MSCLRFPSIRPPLLPLFLALVVALAAFGSPAPAAQAFDRRSGDAIVIPAGQVVDDDLAAAGRLVRIDGTVHGDVYAFGQNVTVTGTIDGDLIAAAQQVVVDGQVRGDVRVAGALVQLNGAVGRNVTGVGQLLQLGSGGRVGGSLAGAGETLSLSGDIGGAAAAAAHDLTVQGRIGRNAEMALTSLTLGPRASIGGNLTYYADHQLDIPAQAVAGSVRYEHTSRDLTQRATRGAMTPTRGWTVLGNFFSLAWLAGSAVAGLVLLRLFPRLAAEFLGVLEARPLASLGLGAATLIGTLPVAVLMAITIVGLPLSALLIAGYFAGAFTGWLLLAIAAGSLLVGLVRGARPWHPSWAFLLGLVVLYVASHLPFVGGLVWFAGASVGMGAFLIALYRTWRRATPPPIPSAPPLIAVPAT